MNSTTSNRIITVTRRQEATLHFTPCADKAIDLADYQDWIEDALDSGNPVDIKDRHTSKTLGRLYVLQWDSYVEIENEADE